MTAARDAQTHDGSTGHSDLLAIAVLAVFTIVVRGAWFGDPNADFDEQLYSLIGNAMLDGKLPFVDLWDRKPWGLFAIFAAAHWIGGPGPLAYQALGTVFTLAGALMTVALARKFVDRPTSLVAGTLYVLLMTIYGAYSGNSEVFHVPMMLAMAILVRDVDHPQARSRALAAMLIGGLALQVKYTVFPQCLFFGLWALWGQYRHGTGLIALAGLATLFAVIGVLPTALVGAGYAFAGHWDAFVFANFQSFFDRTPADLGRMNAVSAIGIAPLACLAAIGLIAALRSPAFALKAHPFSLLWLLAAATTVFLPSTTYFYYLAAMAPPIVVLSMPLPVQGEGKRINLSGTPGEVLSLLKRINLIGIMPGAVLLLLMPQQYQLAHDSRNAMSRLANAIAPYVDASAGRCLLVFDGPTSLYRMSGSCLPSRFVYPDHLNNVLERDALGIRQEDEVARILAGRPPVIVTADTPVTPQNPEAERRVRDALKRHYRPLATEVLRNRVIRAWVLRS
jgi:hypothetical protein